ncbi:MAG: NAD-dependent epimerase [Phycisphaerales bacterium]|nr:NAD-dependent epimerase [Phycisphaerales bacterium]
MKILVTGSAGFIGAAVAHKLLDRGDEVVGLDNCNDYYDPALKRARLQRLHERSGFEFAELDCANREGVAELFRNSGFNRAVHLAAQAGVRYSIDAPFAYVESNMAGFLPILEGCRNENVEHLVYASSSSVYGGNKSMPYSVHDSVDHPVSLYAATKKANELMAHAYSHLFDLPTTGLRFFSVYGPWGRPDMAPFIFTKAILAGEPIKVFNHGRHSRDFTYIDDIVEGVVRTLDQPATPSAEFDPRQPDPGVSSAPWRVYNLGRGEPVQLLDYIRLFEKHLEKEAVLEMLPMQDGDMPDTAADVEALKRDMGYAPSIPLEVGIPRFLDWYREYYGV